MCGVRKGDPPTDPSLLFLPHSVIHQGIVILPHEYLLHCLPTSAPCPGWDPHDTASLPAPGSPTSRSVSCANPIIILSLRPSLAPLFYYLKLLCGLALPALPASFSPSLAPGPPAVGASGSAPNVLSVCHHCAFAQAVPPPCSHSLTLPLETQLRGCSLLLEAISSSQEELGASLVFPQIPGLLWVMAIVCLCISA